MIPQTFDLHDVPVVLILVLLEGLLSADNALVLAIMVRHLPPVLRKKALIYGLGGAFVFRLIAILLATKILELWWLQALGALYLVYLPIKHFRDASKSHDINAPKAGGGFWATVIAVEFADIAFAVDSVLAAVAFVAKPEKLWVVYLGAMMGVVLLRFAASFFVSLLDRYPMLDHLAYSLVAWVGIKLAFMAGHNGVQSYNAKNPTAPLGFTIPEMHPGLFWTVMTIMIVGGTWLAVTRPRKKAAAAEQESTDDSPQESAPEAGEEA